jgi:ABC-2 type transport system ATP-binding protein
MELTLEHRPAATSIPMSVPPVAHSTAPASPAAEPLLLFDRVSKWYGTVLALNQVTLELRGGITGLVGANGAGKSTLIRLATGQIHPSLGGVTVLGNNATDWRARRLIGYCPDVDNFYEEMSGRQFVTEMAKLCGYRSADVRERTDRVLERVGMKDRSHRRLRGYSKGMRQRIKLAQALLTDPKLLVLDEPLGGIDPVGRQELLDLFRALAEQGTCLFVSSHELEELEKLTNHIAVMARGRIAAVGTLEQIRDRLENVPLSVLVETDRPRELASRLLSFEGVIGVDVPNDDSSTLVVRAKQSQRFFREFGRLVVDDQIDIRRFEPLDDSAHAILGYVLGGSGKT